MQRKKHLGLHWNGIFFNNLVTFSFSCRDYSRHYRLENVPKMIWKKKLRRKHFNTEWALDLLTF